MFYKNDLLRGGGGPWKYTINGIWDNKKVYQFFLRLR